jgi:hypothetical protein
MERLNKVRERWNQKMSIINAPPLLGNLSIQFVEYWRVEDTEDLFKWRRWIGDNKILDCCGLILRKIGQHYTKGRSPHFLTIKVFFLKYFF